MNVEETIHNLTVEQLKQGNPTLATALVAEGHAAGLAEGKALATTAAQGEGFSLGQAKGMEEGLKAGAESERQRIRDVEGQSLPGHSALVESLKWDGKTSGPEAAIKVLQAEKETRGIHLEQLKKDTLAPVAQPTMSVGLESNPDATTVESKAKAREQKIAAHMAEHKANYRSAAFAVSKAHPELFKDR